MSLSPTSTNGNGSDVTPNDLSDISIRVEVAIQRSKQAHESATLAHSEALGAHEVAKETRDMVRFIHSTLARVVTEHLELRTGIPATWKRRLLLVSLSASIGGFSSALTLKVLEHFGWR